MRGLDAWLTREGPTFTPDPHEPWVAWPSYTGRVPWETPADWPMVCLGDPDAGDGPAFIVGSDESAAAWARALNLWLAPRPDEAGRYGQCTVCGDFHGEMRDDDCPLCWPDDCDQERHLEAQWREETGSRDPQGPPIGWRPRRRREEP